MNSYHPTSKLRVVRLIAQAGLENELRHVAAGYFVQLPSQLTQYRELVWEPGPVRPLLNRVVRQAAATFEAADTDYRGHRFALRTVVADFMHELHPYANPKAHMPGSVVMLMAVYDIEVLGETGSEVIDQRTIPWLLAPGEVINLLAMVRRVAEPDLRRIHELDPARPLRYVP